MPLIQFQRTWCKTCKDWTLHHYVSEQVYCKNCNTLFTPIMLSDIPDEKVQEQRQRYNEHKRNKLNKFVQDHLLQTRGGVLGAMLEMGMFDTDSVWGRHTEIAECDAGQINIDKARTDARNEQYRIQQEERRKLAEEVLKYRGLGRNELCICGSNKKYKHCCYKRINEL